MTLKPCRECGELVSSEANSCPKCGLGHPTRKFSRALLIFAAISIILIMIIETDKNDTASSSVQDMPNEIESKIQPTTPTANSSEEMKVSRPDSNTADEAVAPLFMDQHITLVELNHALQTCFMLSVARGENGVQSMRSCDEVAVYWCNRHGMKTSQAIKTSPVTGKVLLNNQTCIDRLDAQYTIIRGDYEAEYMNYTECENHGYPYHPNLFDIRKFLEENAQ